MDSTHIHGDWFRMNCLRSQRGEAFVETALVGLVVMMLALALIQFGLWYHAQHVVLGAAQEGAHAAALDGADARAGEARATELVRAGLGTLPEGVSVSTNLTERTTSVDILARMPAIVPFFPEITLRAEGRAFRERFVLVGERP